MITHVRVISRDRTLTELRCKFKPRELKFFYDHEIDHLPGMLEACAMRQAALALAHLVYETPMDYVALLDWMTIRLFNYGELETQTIARFKLRDLKQTPHRKELQLEGLMIQGDYPVMGVEGTCVMLSPELGRSVRHRKKAGTVGDGSLSLDLAPSIAH